MMITLPTTTSTVRRPGSHPGSRGVPSRRVERETRVAGAQQVPAIDPLAASQRMARHPRMPQHAPGAPTGGRPIADGVNIVPRAALVPYDAMVAGLSAEARRAHAQASAAYRAADSLTWYYCHLGFPFDQTV